MKPEKKPLVLDTSKIARYVWNGRKDALWYADTKKHLENVLPDEEINLIIDLLAATSISTSLKANVAEMFKALYQFRHGLEFVGFLPAKKFQLDLLRQGKPLGGRKIRNFAEAMKGDPNAVVVDIWIVRAFGLENTYWHEKTGRDRQRSPSDKEYDIIEAYIKENAPLMGLEPRQLQSMIWGGIRVEQTGKGNTTRYDSIIRSRIKYALFADEGKYTMQGYNI